LTSFPPETLSRLSTKFEPVKLNRKMVLVEPGVTISDVYFPDYGIVSLVKVMRDGRTAEVGAVGPEGMIGVPALLGISQPDYEGVVQLDGVAHRIDKVALKAEMIQSQELRELILRYMEYRVSQLAQTSACNRLHTLTQRCYRWLLTARDSAQSETFTLTHEFLALRMGVSRPRLSLALQVVQQKGLILYRYATVTIADRRALEEGACECYWTLRAEAELVYQPRFVVGAARSTDRPASPRLLQSAPSHAPV
jgi:CRP-like cAMP-binding protein